MIEFLAIPLGLGTLWLLLKCIPKSESRKRQERLHQQTVEKLKAAAKNPCADISIPDQPLYTFGDVLDILTEDKTKVIGHGTVTGRKYVRLNGKNYICYTVGGLHIIEEWLRPHKETNA